MRYLLSKSSLLALVIICCSGALTGCKETKKVVTHKESLIVSQTNNTERLFFSGEIKPLKETAISIVMDAKVIKLNFNFGNIVKKGDVLIELDSPQQQKEYDEALTAYLKSKDDLDVALAKFSGTESLWKEKLVAENVFKSDKSTLFTNKIAFFQAKTKLLTLAKRLKGISTKEMLNLSLSDFEHVKEILNQNKNRIVIRAPHDGIMLLPPKNEDSHELRVGSLVKASDVVALIGDISGLAITIKIPEINIDKIKTGMLAEVTGIAFPNIILKSVVQSINAQANTSPGDSGGLPIFTAKVVVPSLTKVQEALIKVGMSASVNVILKERSMIMIPIKAVNLHSADVTVMLEEQNGKQTKVNVETGISTNDKVQIIKGLKVGDRIVWTEE